MAFCERRFFTVNEALQQVVDADSGDEHCSHTSSDKLDGSSSESDPDDGGTEDLLGAAKRQCVHSSITRPPPMMEDDSNDEDFIFNFSPLLGDEEDTALERVRLGSVRKESAQSVVAAASSSDESR